MTEIKALIERADDGGVSVFSEDVKGTFGYGLSEEEAKEDFLSLLEEVAEDYKERTGEFPSWFTKGYTVTYTELKTE